MQGSDWPSELVELNEGNFESVVAEYQNVVIDCWAPWCGPCLALEPAMEELAKEYRDRVLFAKMNTDENLEIARKLGIMSLPTLLYFKGGEYEDRMTSGIQKRTIQEKVEELLAPR
ncbi:MAG: thioredoxin [Thermoplasmata archaeon]